MVNKIWNAISNRRVLAASRDKLFRLRDFLRELFLSWGPIKRAVIACFQIVALKGNISTLKTNWMGAHAQKYPTDLWVYQEIIYETKPDVIIECGTNQGGTSLFLACICDIIGHGSVVSIDVESQRRPQHTRIKYLLGSSTAPETVETVKSLLQGANSVLVILDSDHSAAHVLDELKIYSKLVTRNNYLIVEDTLLNGYPVLSAFGPGPMEAVREFTRGNSDFVIDSTREKFLMTLNHTGYLRRV